MKKILVTLIAVTALSHVAFAAIEPGRSAAQETVQTIIDQAKLLGDASKKASASKRIESLVDFAELTKNSLGDHAKEMSADQRAKVQNLLKTILTRTVYPKAPQFFSDVAINYSGESQNDALTHVSSVISKNNKRSSVEYWLKDTAQGPRVVDIAIEGERWVENVQLQFDELIQKKGVNGLIARMQTRANELSKKQ